MSTFAQCDIQLRDENGSWSTWVDVYNDLGTLGNGWNNRATFARFS